MTLALDLARAVNCLEDERPCGECTQCRRIARGLHADVQVVGLETDGSGEGRSRVAIGIDQVREVQRDVSLMPYEGRCRVFIFDGVEHLSDEAANSLLKTLEEPPKQVLLILLASDAGALLPTITSRCQVLALRPVSRRLIACYLETRHNADRNTADEIARLSEGWLGWAVEAIARPEILESIAEKLGSMEEVVKGGLEHRFAYAAGLATTIGRNRDLGRQELTLWLEWWRDVLLVREEAPSFVKYRSRMDTLRAVSSRLSSAQVAQAIGAVRRTAELLERNVNPRLALEDLMLTLPRA